ncbi:hypothetical protein [Legionella cherrii]|uniref:Hemoglobin (Protozoan/cyanobacterial globin family) n=1 Tax=Legionella cherrii TaxID=28084 RepID=A0A0W0S7K6_9GAMM|nr:hypothetical protein [Legionella cherrii]KTC79113.1 hemoglobin (protozoan/cyanobacterial globin family) [Legionella cherrii]VEB36576.1 hemoglobin (protozoan/cyanobacterial globin family) [Legionella cherrii]
MNQCIRALGNQKAVNSVVDMVSRQILRNEHVSHFFDNIDMEQQSLKQREFFTHL